MTKQMDKKLYISLVFSTSLIEIKSKSQENPMYNFCAKFRQIFDICKCHSKNLVNSPGNVPRVGVVPYFSDLEVIALSLTMEALEIDSENCLFRQLSKFKDEMPNLISKKLYNDRRKMTMGPCEEIRKRIADRIDGSDWFPFIRNYAKNVKRLFTRIIGKISAFTILQYININNKPIGQIKYALL